eukprot:5926041-Karenia_brevis.AAC.1
MDGYVTMGRHGCTCIFPLVEESGNEGSSHCSLNKWTGKLAKKVFDATPAFNNFLDRLRDVCFLWCAIVSLKMLLGQIGKHGIDMPNMGINGFSEWYERG